MDMSIPFAYSSTIGALSSKFSSASVTSASDERRKEGNGNGNGTKLLDPSSQPHPPLHYSPKQPPPPQQQQHNPDPTPDQHPIVPISTGSNIKTPTGTTGKALVSIRYRECLKNHAANVGGHVVDGCGEFMPSGGEALKCAACDCHRNFHRKVIDGISPTQLLLPNKSIILSPPPVHQKHPMGLTLPTSPPSGPMMGSGATESSSEDHDILPTPPPFLQAKKRFRTKFSREQKEKMMEFAEKIGWRIQRHEEHVLERFCDEVGVKRNVLKVWMHNNKQALKRKHFQDENEIAIPRPVDHQEVDYKTSEVV